MKLPVTMLETELNLCSLCYIWRKCTEPRKDADNDQLPSHMPSLLAWIPWGSWWDSQLPFEKTIFTVHMSTTWPVLGPWIQRNHELLHIHFVSDFFNKSLPTLLILQLNLSWSILLCSLKDNIAFSCEKDTLASLNLNNEKSFKLFEQVWWYTDLRTKC